MSDIPVIPPRPPIEETSVRGPLQLVRLPVERSQAAVDFLHARSEGVMDLIAHFWERLSQTPPLQRGDLHLVAAVPAGSNDSAINISTITHTMLAGAMLYVPKAHRADVLAIDPGVAGAFAAYIRHQGPKAVGMDKNDTPSGDAVGGANGSVPAHLTPLIVPSQFAPGSGPNSASSGMSLIDLSTAVKGTPTPTALPAEAIVAGKAVAPSNGRVPIDFLTGHADGIAWMTPLLLPLVNRKSPARQMVNVVMQLPNEAVCHPDPAVRVAREADVPTLNRWRRQYKEERGILFDADLDAWVQTGRVFVYEHDRHVVAVAKFDLELPRLIEIGGVYTFPEFRTRGFGAKIVSDLACRVRAAGKIPTLQVDEQNGSALRLYSAMGWRAMGKLARVWLTG